MPMTMMRAAAAAMGLALLAQAAMADAIRLKPADPQPDATALAAGLSVRYAYPGDVTDLRTAESYRDSDNEVGAPLPGFDYPDGYPNQKVMTARRATKVAAYIDGFVRFDQPGIWRMQFHSNDGLEVRIGGAKVYRHDGRHACQTNGWEAEFEVPTAGWYPIKALYFQRLGTFCLMMEWQAPGAEMSWTPNEVFFHAAP
jgi:hypothetical protein